MLLHTKLLLIKHTVAKGTLCREKLKPFTSKKTEIAPFFSTLGQYFCNYFFADLRSPNKNSPAAKAAIILLIKNISPDVALSK